MTVFKKFSQMASLFVLSAFLCSVLVDSFIVRKSGVHPQCEGNESCLYFAMGYRFEFCSCSPQQNICGWSNGVINQDVEYYFCRERVLPTCNIGDVSTIVYGLKTYVECVCPNHFELIPHTTPDKPYVEYFCESAIVCSDGEVCAQQNAQALIKKCVCAEGSYCAMPDAEHGFLDGYCAAE